MWSPRISSNGDGGSAREVQDQNDALRAPERARQITGGEGGYVLSTAHDEHERWPSYGGSPAGGHHLGLHVPPQNQHHGMNEVNGGNHPSGMGAPIYSQASPIPPWSTPRAPPFYIPITTAPPPRWTVPGSLDPTTGIFYRTPESMPRQRAAKACEPCRVRKARVSPFTNRGEHG
jgi:hypothetical protein